MLQTLASDPFLILLNNPKQPLNTRNYFLKVYFFFQIQFFMDKVLKNERSLELITSHSSGHVQKNSFIHYIISDQVWWCNVKQFLSYSKNYICKFMLVNSWHKLFHFYLTFWIWKGREKTKISREQKERFRWNKKHFS